MEPEKRTVSCDADKRYGHMLQVLLRLMQPEQLLATMSELAVSFDMHTIRTSFLQADLPEDAEKWLAKESGLTILAGGRDGLADGLNINHFVANAVIQKLNEFVKGNLHVERYAEFSFVNFQAPKSQ